LSEISVSPNPIKLNKGIRQRERCDPKGEPKEGNPKRDSRSGETFQIFCACNEHHE